MNKEPQKFTRWRRDMVAAQIVARGVADPLVIQAMTQVPRHLFVSEALMESAYGDFPLPIGQGQTISQPFIIAEMTQSLGLTGSERILEIGTGSGYQAAVLAQIVYGLRAARVLDGMKARIGIRIRQKAFHPNATQFTLHLGDDLFGFWRQSIDRSQSIFAIHNVTHREVTMPKHSINLIGGADWVDLLSGERIDGSDGDIVFAPYQCRWISNRR